MDYLPLPKRQMWELIEDRDEEHIVPYGITYFTYSLWWIDQEHKQHGFQRLEVRT